MRSAFQFWGIRLFLIFTIALFSAPLIAGSPGGTLIVLNKSEASAGFIDLQSGETVATLTTGDGPHEVAVTADGKLAVVSNYGGKQSGNSLTVIDVENLKVLKTISLGEYERPHGIVFLKGDSVVLVTAEARKALIAVNVKTGKILRTFTTDQDVSHMVDVTPEQKLAFVANIGSGSVSVVDLIDGKLLKNIPIGKGAEGVAVTPDGTEVWVSNREEDTISIISVKSLKIKDTVSVGSFPIRIKFSPDGKFAMVSLARSGEMAVVDRVRREVTHRIAMKLKAKADTASRLFKNVFGGSPVPIGLVIHPKGKFAYVANTNADAIAVVNLDTWQVENYFQTGKQPDGLGFSPILVKP